MEIQEHHKDILKHLAGGGLVAFRIYGKKTMTIDTATSKRGVYVGMTSLFQLVEAGLIRRGDPSPYKSGKSYPYVLTDQGRAVAA